jgi:predicted nuclease of predicted toxin-antitoxin system
MRLLADENFPGAAIVALREDGHDVVWVREVARGVDDHTVLALASGDRRVLLTFDKDFGELARASPLPPECGVVLFRIPMPSASAVARRVVAVLRSRNDWVGHFSVAEPGRVRMRALP